MGRSDDVTRSSLRLSGGPSAGAPRPGVAGRVGGTIFFLIWLAIPSIMVAVLARQTWQNAQTWRWNATDCTILRSAVETTGSDKDYAFRVEYAYHAGAAGDLEPRALTSTVYALDYRGSRDYSDAQSLVLDYAAGAKSTCYVNPSNPREAVLKRNGFGSAAMILFPMLFIAIGAGGLWYTWRGKRTGWGGGSISTGATSSGPISNGARRTASGLVVFFCLFGGCGLVISVAMGRNTVKMFGARSWLAVPATVESSRVRSHSDSDSTTYSVDVLYRYEVKGRPYKSNRYSFMTGSSSGYDGKRQIVNRLRPGTKTTAYVNPADPTDAVLERGFTWDMLFLGIPLLFLAIGVGGAVFTARRAARTRREQAFAGSSPSGFSPGRTTRAYTPRRSLTAEAGPVALRPRQSPGLKLLGISIVAVFWNGIVSIFVYQAVTSWMRGRGEVCLTIFMVPFVGVGVALVGAVIHSVLAVFNPRVVLVLGKGELALGETAELRWSVTGSAGRIHKLVVRLEGREEATYRQGTDTRTDKSTFFSADLLDTENPAEIREGKAEMAVPQDTMHTFTGGNNQIVWLLTVHGHIRGWADVKDEYAVTVAPRPKPAAAREPSEGARPQEATWNA